MNVSDLITLHEGSRSKPYTDTVGKLTIGIGHNLSDKGLRPDEIKLIFDHDLQDAWDECAKHPWFLALTEARKAACLDLMFNIGPSRFRGFLKFIAAMNAKDYNTAAYELIDSAWFREVGSRGVHLVDLIRLEKWPA